MRWATPVILSFVCVVSVATVPNAVAQTSEPAPSSTSERHFEFDHASVVIDGERVIEVAGISAYPAERRARDIERRIRAVADDPDRPATLTIEERAGASWILSDGQSLVTVTTEDGEIEGVERQLLAEIYRASIAASIARYRAARQPAALAHDALLAAGATLALLVAFWAGLRVFRRLQAYLERRHFAYVHDVSIQTFQIVSARQLWRVLAGLLRLAWMILLTSVVLFYLGYVLELFPWTRLAGRSVIRLTLEPLRELGEATIGAIPRLVFLAALFAIARYVLKLVRLFFEGVAAGTVTLRHFEPEWSAPTERLVKALVILLTLVVAYPYIPGSDTDAFKGVSVFLGLVLSLGSSSFISNLIAGYSLTYRRAFKLGDRVKIGDYMGDVIEVRVSATHLRTPKNEEVIVPNSAIVGSEVVNYSSMARNNGLILHTTVGIGYEVPWRQVEAMLLEAAARTPGLRTDKAPYVLQKELADFSVIYELNVYCASPQQMFSIYTNLHRNILDLFNEYGVQIMTPAYEQDPAEPKVVPKRNWYAAPASPPATGQGSLARKSS